MRAVRISTPGGPEVLELVDLPTPEPGSGEVQVQASAFGLGRPDVMIRTGKYKWMPPLPAILGNEMAGVVTALGDDVDAHWLGRPVLVSARELPTRGGCCAQQLVVPANALIELPENIDPLHAVALPNYQLAWGLLHDATRGRRPQRLFLNGSAGGVGSALIDLARVLGLEVIAGASTEDKRKFALAQGAATAVDTSNPETGALVAQVKEVTAGRGVDAAYDHLGGPGFAEHLELLAPFGLVVSYNALRGLPPPGVFAALRGHAAHALGIVTYNMHAYDGRRDARRALLDMPMRWMSDGRLKPAIAPALPMSQVSRAHQMLDARSVLGKLVLTPDG